MSLGYGVNGAVVQGKENRTKDRTLRNTKQQQQPNRLKTASKIGGEPGMNSARDTEQSSETLEKNGMVNSVKGRALI